MFTFCDAKLWSIFKYVVVVIFIRHFYFYLFLKGSDMLYNMKE